MHPNWNVVWLKVFGRIEWLGIDIGFWLSAALCLLAIAAINLVCWSVSPAEARTGNNEINPSLDDKIV
jgi:hypothetical protein